MNYEPTHVDLFSGIGGFALAAQWAGFRTVAFCEIDPYCQAVLKARFGVVEDAKGKRCSEARSKQSAASNRQRLHRDIRSLDGTRYAGVDLLTGGFPCQPFSVAGKRGGSSDDRFLWPEMLRVVSEARPAWVLGENVAGIVTMELDRVLSDLENIGYSVWPIVIPAVAVDARHRRDRVWIVANLSRIQPGRKESRTEWERIGESGESTFVGHSQCAQWRKDAECGGHCEQRKHEQRQAAGGIGESGEVMADTDSGNGNRRVGNVQMGREWSTSQAQNDDHSCGAEWEPQCGLGGVVDGVSRWLDEPAELPRIVKGQANRVSRLKGLGNAIVPQLAFQILKTIRALI